MKEKKVIIEKKYEFIVKLYDDKTTHLERINDGFNSLELLGIANLISLEMKDFIQNKEVKIDIIERKVIVK